MSILLEWSGSGGSGTYSLRANGFGGEPDTEVEQVQTSYYELYCSVTVYVK